MTAFDPKKALEILERRHRRLENEAIDKGAAVYKYLWRGIPPYHRIIHELESERDAAYDRLRDFAPVLRYLEQRIEDEKPDAEKVWDRMKDWDYRHGPGLVEDVALAARELDIDLATV